jgi:hypothetical protein
MRKADREEIYASRGMSPKKVLMESIRASHVAYAFYVKGEIAALFGVVQAISEDKGGMFGIPWVLTGAAVENDRREFWRWSKEGLRIFLDEYGVLANYVDARHEQAIRWLNTWGQKSMQSPSPTGNSDFPSTASSSGGKANVRTSLNGNHGRCRNHQRRNRGLRRNQEGQLRSRRCSYEREVRGTASDC